MSAVYLGTFEAGSPEWSAVRRRAVGGSEVAAVLGLSPWESPFSLWWRKNGELAPIEETPEMEWGKRLEDVVAEKYADEHPEVVPVGMGVAQYAHADRPWQIAAPDRLLIPPYNGDERSARERAEALLEVKTARYADGWGEPGTDEIPLHYRCQVLWYLDVFGLDRCAVAVLIAGSDYREYEVTYDADECELIRNRVAAFVASLDGAPPSIDSHTATYEALRELHPEIDGSDHDLDGRLARRYIAARLATKAAKDEEQHAKSLIADAMGEARRALWDGSVIARRQTKGGGLPYVVGVDLPEITTTTGEAA